jgi:hypothetical protein
MKPTTYTAILVLTLLVALAASAESLCSFASANPGGDPLQLSMPIEHINYTITTINGSLWAKIDGYYPISFLNQSSCDMLPMVYPMPPNSTNIHVYLGGHELEWSNYTQTYPDNLHRTTLGDWWMVSSVLENLSDSFLLQIHYEHPLERVNGSYVFLYDLNIVDYLSPQNPDSTAYFTVRFEGNFSDMHVYTAPPNSAASQWQPKTFASTTEGLTVEMHSQYNSDLPGDLVVVFSDGTAKNQNEQQGALEPTWVIPVVIDVVLIGILLYAKRKTVLSAFSSRKTPT